MRQLAQRLDYTIATRKGKNNVMVVTCDFHTSTGFLLSYFVFLFLLHKIHGSFFKIYGRK